MCITEVHAYMYLSYMYFTIDLKGNIYYRILLVEDLTKTARYKKVEHTHYHNQDVT